MLVIKESSFLPINVTNMVPSSDDDGAGGFFSKYSSADHCYWFCDH